MSDSILGKVIEGLEFARDGRVLEGSAALAELPRLADLLADFSGALCVRLEGLLDSEGKSWLSVSISGEVVLSCQRCLGDVRMPLDIASRLQLIRPGEAWPDDDLADDSADAVAVGEVGDLRSLIEEEVLLALPIAPRHEECEAPGATADEHGSSPFAALVAMKKH